MQSNAFELAFSYFLDRPEYDVAERSLFSIAPAAFSAGWQAAGGVPPQPLHLFQPLDGNPRLD